MSPIQSQGFLRVDNGGRRGLRVMRPEKDSTAIAASQDGGRAASQGTWAASEAGKDEDVDSLLELPEGASPADTSKSVH